MTRLSRDAWGLQLAQVTAQRGTCCRRRVGAILTDSAGHVLATGYNGVAAGLPHCNEFMLGSGPRPGRRFFGQGGGLALSEEQLQAERANPRNYPHACTGAFSQSGTNLDGCEAIHAEQNALLQCKDVREIHTCYCTASPCITCVKLLLNTGCQRVVFLEEYPHPAAGELWLRSGREWIQVELGTG